MIESRKGLTTLVLQQMHFVFVVTYGRSGSTLVQGLLNSLPRTLIRGENGFIVLPLFQAFLELRKFRRRYGKKQHAATSAFYGLAEANPQHLVAAARDAMVKQLLGGIPRRRVRSLGFKEVRWHQIRPQETEQFFEWFDQVFPGSRFVLNQRQHKQVLGSGFWTREEPAAAAAKIRRVEEIQDYLRTSRPDRVLDVSYEELTHVDAAVVDGALRALAEFVHGSSTPRILARMREVLAIGHGPNPRLTPGGSS